MRNSSLMLFSVLANRTVGIRPTYNLLEFFHRCPELLAFFTDQLSHLQLDTMYPPLYPIVLLLSRLLPFDLKEMPKMGNKGELNLKQVRKDRLLELLPLIEAAGRNSNYMGRVMTAKAILPFMEINGIIPYCLAQLQDIASLTANNEIHYKLAAVYHLLSSLIDITRNSSLIQKTRSTSSRSTSQSAPVLSKRSAAWPTSSCVDSRRLSLNCCSRSSSTSSPTIGSSWSHCNSTK